MERASLFSAPAVAYTMCITGLLGSTDEIFAPYGQGETVLIASKNNKAVDVVVERLRATVPLCPVVRAGAASQRQALASDIGRMVGEAERAEPAQGLVEASDQWHQIHRQVQAVHNARKERQLVLQKMQSLEGRLANAPRPAGVPDGLTEDAVVNATAKVKAAFSGLYNSRQFQTLRELDERARCDGAPPEGLPEDIDPSDVKAASEEVGVALRALARRPRLFGRRSRRRRRNRQGSQRIGAVRRAGASSSGARVEQRCAGGS